MEGNKWRKARKLSGPSGAKLLFPYTNVNYPYILYTLRSVVKESMDLNIKFQAEMYLKTKKHLYGQISNTKDNNQAEKGKN